MTAYTTEEITAAFSQEFPGEKLHCQAMPGGFFNRDDFAVVTITSHPTGTPLNVTVFTEQPNGIETALALARDAWGSGPPQDVLECGIGDAV